MGAAMGIAEYSSVFILPPPVSAFHVGAVPFVASGPPVTRGDGVRGQPLGSSEAGLGHLAPAGRLAGDGPLFGFGFAVRQRE